MSEDKKNFGCIRLILSNAYLFNWNNVPGNDSEGLIRYLRDDHDIGWAESAEICKFDDGKTIRIFKDENSVEITINEKEEKVTLKISDGRTHDLKVRKENGAIKICSNTIQSYQSRYIVPPISGEFIKAYHNSDILKESILECASNNSEYDYQTLLDCAMGKTRLEDDVLPKQVKLILAAAPRIDDKRNVIHYSFNRLLDTVDKINKKVKEQGWRHLDLGNLHWDLLLDIEFILYSCRSLLDVFARLTKNIWDGKCQSLPESFSDQVAKATTHEHIDPLYFKYISNLSWFEKLKGYRDELAHKTSLEPQAFPYQDNSLVIGLYATKTKLISLSDINDIVEGVDDFCKFFVQHYNEVFITN
jgi:hypothetical protein